MLHESAGSGLCSGKEGEITVLNLTDSEREILKGALESLEDELRGEIARTDKREWKAALHNEEAVVKKILEKVSGSEREQVDGTRYFRLSDAPGNAERRPK